MLHGTVSPRILLLPLLSSHLIFSLPPFFLVLPPGEKSLARTILSAACAVHIGTNTAARPLGMGTRRGWRGMRLEPLAAGRHWGHTKGRACGGEAGGGRQAWGNTSWWLL